MFRFFAQIFFPCLVKVHYQIQKSFLIYEIFVHLQGWYLPFPTQKQRGRGPNGRPASLFIQISQPLSPGPLKDIFKKVSRIQRSLLKIPGLHIGEPLVGDSHIVDQFGVKGIALGLEIEHGHGDLLVHIFAPGSVVGLGLFRIAGSGGGVQKLHV